MTKNTSQNLTSPARYFPITGDRYSTRAGLSRFGTDFGNDIKDKQLFQFDNTFEDYRNNKLSIRKQSIDNYVCTDTAEPAVLRESAKWLLQHLCREHDDKFSLQTSENGMRLNCHLTNEELLINDNFDLSKQNKITYKNLFDALALQVHEDICLMQKTDSTSQLIAAHLCAANHWSARDKLHMDMQHLHQHVPGFTEENQEPDRLLHSISNKGIPYVRFAWGFSEHAILNQHPTLQTTPQSSNHLFMRIERQVIWPIANTDTVLFTIRTYFRDCTELVPEQRSSIVRAVNSMSEKTLRYKKIDKAGVLNKLNQGL